MKKQINSCCKEKSIRNDVERKYLKISSRIYAGTCIVNPLSNIVASVIKFTVTYWFYVFSWVGKLNFAWHQKKKKNNCTISDLAKPYKYKLVAWKRNIILFIVYSEWSITSKLLKINPIQYYSHKQTNKSLIHSMVNKIYD